MSSKKGIFLSNEANKQAFILMLGEQLEEHGCSVCHAEGDAGLLIAQTVAHYAKTAVTILIGDDTDLLVLLCYDISLQSPFDVYFKPQSRKKNSKATIWNIKCTKVKLGSDICDNILVLHALLGCDTTSRIFGFGKGVVLKKLLQIHILLQLLAY